MTVLVVTVVKLVVLETAAAFGVVVVVEGRHSEHWLHVAHWQMVAQGSNCCRQVERQSEDPPASVVVVANILGAVVVVICAGEVISVVVVVVVTGNVLYIVAVIVGMTTGGDCVGLTIALQSGQAAQVGQRHLMNQGCPFPTQYMRHSLGCCFEGVVA